MMQDPLDFKTRRKIYLLISSNPGINESEVVRLSGLNRGSVRYELEYLQKHELIVCSQEGKFIHYFQKDTLPSAHRTIMKAIMRSIPRSLVVYLLLYPDTGFSRIAEEFDLVPSTISYHLSRLASLGIVEKQRMGKQTLFRLKDPETVSDVLVAFKESYLADLQDKWALRMEAIKRRSSGKGPTGGVYTMLSLLSVDI